ncbi:uncharacterized protein LOC135397845 [Ornithodoros turicata]|uniref:uncharacterized protein LOC135397845 n=1 Tax=Ornithodoros turicata TaxID=34597 RepID=UPI0031386B85
MKAVEDTGFRIVRVVADNHKTNVALFKHLAGGELHHVTAHPLRQVDPLFLSFDPNHLIKNLRTCLLEREMTDGRELLQGGLYLRELLKLQKDLLIKSVRCLSRAHVAPTNLEKMKVKRAVAVFSQPVITALEFLKNNPRSHAKAHLFKDCEATVRFMTIINRWYKLHDIGHRHAQEYDRKPFTSTEDGRLVWLDVSFQQYFSDMKAACAHSQRQFLARETFSATVMTTRSTTAVIEYLLEDLKFDYVLT